MLCTVSLLTFLISIIMIIFDNEDFLSSISCTLYKLKFTPNSIAWNLKWWDNGRYCQVKFTLRYKVILQVLLSQSDNEFCVSCIKIVIFLIYFFYHLLPFFVQIIIFHLMSGREDVAWLAHGRELREMWCCPLPKGLGTSHGPRGLVYTGQPHRD